jgi:hypothetical protein
MWEISYTAQQYLWLLDTFSGHIAMPIAKRDHLYSEITRRLAQRCDGRPTEAGAPFSISPGALDRMSPVAIR